MSTDEKISRQDNQCMQQNQEKDLLESTCTQSSPLQKDQITTHLSVLGRNPFTQAHIYTTLTLNDLQLSNIDAVKEFPHIQHLFCRQNELQSLSPLQYIPLLLTIDVTGNQLTEVLDFTVPKCNSYFAWRDGGGWIGSLLRKATLDKNRIVSMPHYELARTHPYLLELRLAHNSIEVISGLSQLRFLRLLDLSHNKLTTTLGLIRNEDLSCGLQALSTLLLSGNQLTEIDSTLALLPRLTHLNVAYNQVNTLSSLENCSQLQQLELAHNNITDINELNVLAGLRYVGYISLDGNPFVVTQIAKVFYRARVIRRLLQIEYLDNERVTYKEKVKALVMHGSDLEARRQVAAKYLPQQEFIDFLPPIIFEDDKLLELPLRCMSYQDQLVPNSMQSDSIEGEENLDDRN
ncbi:putative leucine-rich repeat domain superfamily [Plasmopara halstedii]